MTTPTVFAHAQRVANKTATSTTYEWLVDFVVLLSPMTKSGFAEVVPIGQSNVKHGVEPNWDMANDVVHQYKKNDHKLVIERATVYYELNEEENDDHKNQRLSMGACTYSRIFRGEYVNTDSDPSSFLQDFTHLPPHDS